MMRHDLGLTVGQFILSLFVVAFVSMSGGVFVGWMVNEARATPMERLIGSLTDSLLAEAAKQ